MSFAIFSTIRPSWALSPALFNSLINCIFGQVLQGYPGVQVGTNVHESNLAYTDDIVLPHRWHILEMECKGALSIGV